jgi:hypothetical protein
MSEQERDQREEESAEEREETVSDLDIPEEEGRDVVGGGKVDANQND